MSNGNEWERYAKLSAKVGQMLLDRTRRLEDWNGILQDFVGSGRWSNRKSVGVDSGSLVSESAKSKILELISAGEEIIIAPTAGSRTIARAKNVFRGWVDPNFKQWGTDMPGKAKPATPAEVHEMRRDAIFADMFGSLGRPISELVFTQDQIIRFCEDHPEWLRTDGYATFFLFEENKELLVARVYAATAGLNADAHRFEDSDVRHGESCPRVVVPQQTLST